MKNFNLILNILILPLSIYFLYDSFGLVEQGIYGVKQHIRTITDVYLMISSFRFLSKKLLSYLDNEFYKVEE